MTTNNTEDTFIEFYLTEPKSNNILTIFDLVDITKLLEFGTKYLLTISENCKNKTYRSNDEFDKDKNKLKTITKNYNNLIMSYRTLMN